MTTERRFLSVNLNVRDPDWTRQNFHSLLVGSGASSAIPPCEPLSFLDCGNSDVLMAAFLCRLNSSCP